MSIGLLFFCKMTVFSEYMKSTGKRYDDHFATLCKRAREEAAEKQR